MFQKPKLSLWEYVTFVAALSRTVAALLGASLIAGFRGSSGAPTFKRQVLYSALKVFNSSLSLRQSQAINPTTSEVYEAWAKSKGFEPQVVDVGNGTLGCWIGDKNAEVVIVWFHGGGYVLMANNGHPELIWNAVSKAQEKGKKVAGFLLQYDIAPQEKYPRQLIQAATALQYLTKEVGLSPSQILLGGDSAGGNLSLGLISSILHPHPEVPAVTLGDKTFKGLFLISPWVTFDQKASAFKKNINRDVLRSDSLKLWSDSFMGKASTDNYNTPLNATPEWWSGLPAKRVLVMGGGDELLIDDIEELASKLKKHNEDKVEVLIGARDCHDGPLMDVLFGEPPGKQTAKLYDWISDQI